MATKRVEGAATQAKGGIKDALGKLTGDARLQAEGQADKLAGKAQVQADKPAGKASDAAKDAGQA